MAAFKLGSLFYCLVLDTTPLPNHIMKTPYEHLLGIVTLGTLFSAIAMIDTLKLIILIFTAIGTVIKLIEQAYKSRESLTHFINLICKTCTKIWKKIRGQK